MRISAKGRYALAAMISLAQQYEAGTLQTIISLSEQLGISKIYLEQVFSLLKKGSLVTSVKGAYGGYILAYHPRAITALEILGAVETSLFEPTVKSVEGQAPAIEAAMQHTIFGAMNTTIQTFLEGVTLEDLVMETERNKSAQDLMYYI